MWPGFSTRVPHRLKTGATPRAFSLIELLVVIVIITVLLGAVVTVGRGVVNKGQLRDTEAMLKVVRQAVDQFHDEAPLAGVSQPAGGGDRVFYTARYGNYPPDELEVFTVLGLPDSSPPGGSLAPGRAEMEPSPEEPNTYPNMKFHNQITTEQDYALEHRDQAAMLLAIRLFSDRASSILDAISPRFWSDGAVDRDGKPIQYLDRGKKKGFDSDDEQIRWLVDAWGVPISYMAQRDWDAAGEGQDSSNHLYWNQASTEMIALNGGAPILMSYGPNGRNQLTEANVDNDFTAVLIGDWVDNRRIDNPLNDDNAYADSTLAPALARGKEQH